MSLDTGLQLEQHSRFRGRRQGDVSGSLLPRFFLQPPTFNQPIHHIQKESSVTSPEKWQPCGSFEQCSQLAQGQESDVKRTQFKVSLNLFGFTWTPGQLGTWAAGQLDRLPVWLPKANGLVKLTCFSLLFLLLICICSLKKLILCSAPTLNVFLDIVMHWTLNEARNNFHKKTSTLFELSFLPSPTHCSSQLRNVFVQIGKSLFSYYHYICMKWKMYLFQS